MDGETNMPNNYFHFLLFPSVAPNLQFIVTDQQNILKLKQISVMIFFFFLNYKSVSNVRVRNAINPSNCISTIIVSSKE